MKKLTNADAVLKLQSIYNGEYELLDTIDSTPIEVRHIPCKTTFKLKKVNELLNQKELCPCPTCAAKKKVPVTKDAADARFTKFYGNKFKLVKFKNLTSPCSIKCLNCGCVFTKKDCNFLVEKSTIVCPSCGKEMKVESELQNILNSATDGKYYTWVSTSENLKEKHTIKHVCGCEYEVKPNIFKNGKGRCPECNKERSKTRRSIVAAIKKINKIETISLYKVNSLYTVDIFIPSKNIAIDIIDPYWSSEAFEGKTYKKLKVEALEELGIDLIQISKNEWYINTLENIMMLKEMIFPEYVEIEDCVLLDKTLLQKFITENKIYINISQLNYGIYSGNKIIYICGLTESKSGEWNIEYVLHISGNSGKNILKPVLKELAKTNSIKSVKCIISNGDKFLEHILTENNFKKIAILPEKRYLTDFKSIYTFSTSCKEYIWDSGSSVYMLYFKKNFRHI